MGAGFVGGRPTSGGPAGDTEWEDKVNGLGFIR